MRTIEEHHDSNGDRFENEEEEEDEVEPSLQPEDLEDNSEDVHQDEEVQESAPKKKRKRRKKKKDNAVTQDQMMRVFFWTRAISFLGLLVMTALLCWRAYELMVDHEQDLFEEDWEVVGIKVATAFEELLQQRMGILAKFAMDVSSSATNSGEQWPFVTMPDFAIRAQSSAHLSDAMSLSLCPIVHNATQREEWHEYIAENHTWVQEGIAHIDDTATTEVYVPEEIWRFGPQGYEVETGPGPYVVQWQSYPALEAHLANYNLQSHPFYAAAIDSVVASGQPVLVNSYNLTDPATMSDPRGKAMVDAIVNEYNEAQENDPQHYYDHDPVVSALLPVFDDIDTNNSDRNVVAIILARLYWRSYFHPQVLPTGFDDGIVVVMGSNNCEQEFSYRIDETEATFLGIGDRHDRDYSSGSEESFSVQKELNVGSAASGGCQYDITIYPSATYQSQYQTDLPLLFAISLAGMFLVVSIFHFVLACLVERRRTQLIDKASKSSAVVKDLFPKQVRKQVYADQKARKKAKASDDDESETAEQRFDPKNAIANLYPECTICFGDIAGFTKWSSTRSPLQVFELLEAIYGAFDRIADRLHVFKIETIGDCYVCATGLPKKQPAHAVIMARFASECLEALQDLIALELRDRLGEETAGLAMRFGMHSGPVTAGCLRGAKQRFQIFGDTVNTSARMESNGTRGMIQASEATATLLTKAGKEGWLTPREDLVAAKGKGMMQCYWVNTGFTSGKRKDVKKRVNMNECSETSVTHTADDLGQSTAVNTEC